MTKPKINLDKKYGLFIGGEFVEGESGETLDVYCPADGELLASITQASEKDVDRAVEAAWEGFNEYKKTNRYERAKILNKIADIIDENAEHLAMVETLDNGKPIRETRNVDIPLASEHFIKILLLWQIPNNLIVNLVIWFASFAVIYLFFISRIDSIDFINKFKIIFPFTLFPLLAMMFFAIYLRIREYGITENRYLVVAGGVWILLSLIYYIFYRDNSNITVPIFLSVIILISGIGPASATSLSVRSQNSRFEKLLKENKMLAGEEIKPNLNIDSDAKNHLIYLTDK